MRRIFKLAIFALIALVGCTQDNLVLPPPIIIDDNPIHTHDWGSPVDYDLVENTLYAIYQCECGEVKREVISTPSNTINATGDDAEEALKSITGGCTVIVDDNSAQKALDLISDGCTIYFSAGTYGDEALSIRPGKNNVQRIESSTGDDVPIDSLSPSGHYHYYASLKNVRLIADEEAVFNCPLTLFASHISEYGAYDAVREQVRAEDETTGTYYAHIIVENMEISNFHFSGEGNNIYMQYALRDDGSYLDGLLISGCEFEDTGSTNVNMAIRMLTDIGIDNGYAMQNISIENCVMTNCYQGVYVQNAHNISVIGCDISNTTHNAIAIQTGGNSSSSTDNDVFTGEVRIKDNVISNTGDRAIRFGNGQDATIDVSGNIFVSPSYDTERELLRCSSFQNCNYTFTDNKLDGTPIGNDSGSDELWIVSV